jgi:hypothetical protein
MSLARAIAERVRGKKPKGLPADRAKLLLLQRRLKKLRGVKGG